MTSNPIRRTNRKSKKAREAFIAELLGSTVAAQIFSMRSARKWTQQQLANAIYTVQTRIPVLENPNYRNYSINTLLRIAGAFDVGLIVRFAKFKDIEDWAIGSTVQDLSPPSFGEEEALLAASGDKEAVSIPESGITVKTSSDPIRGHIDLTHSHGMLYRVETTASRLSASTKINFNRNRKIKFPVSEQGVIYGRTATRI